MLKKSQYPLNKLFTSYLLIFIFTFFFIIEWRWQILLLGIKVPNPHIFVACLSIPIIVISMMENRRKNTNFWLLYILIIYFLLIALINIPELTITGGYKVTTEIGVWCIGVALFVVACNEKIWEFIYKHTKIITILFFSYTLTPLLILFIQGHAAEANLNLREAIWLTGMVENSDYGVVYQSFGDKIVILSFIVFSLSTNKFIKIMILAVSLISLYVVGSKASMVGYLFSCIVFFFISLYYDKHYIKFWTLGLSCICILLFVWGYIVGNSSLQKSSNWVISAIASAEQDGSVTSRKRIEEENQKSRNSRLMFGNYKFDTKLGRLGTYTHSALGLVDYYGVIVFGIATTIWLYLLFKLLIAGRKKLPIINATLMSMIFYSSLFIIARFPLVSYLTYWVLGSAILAIGKKDIKPC